MSWMEERRFEWVPLVNDFLSKVIAGTTIIVVTDNERNWFNRYVCQSFNQKSKNRPFLPLVSLNSLGHSLEDLTTTEDYDLLSDMLNISFKDEYIFWYIGKSRNERFRLAKKREDSFMWVMDEEIQNSFFMRSNDELLDIKLLHLVRLLDKTVDSILFGEISLDG